MVTKSRILLYISQLKQKDFHDPRHCRDCRYSTRVFGLLKFTVFVKLLLTSCESDNLVASNYTTASSIYPPLQLLSSTLKPIRFDNPEFDLLAGA